MSTAARKATRRAAAAARAINPAEAKRQIDAWWAARRSRTATPVPDRQSNQAYPHLDQPSGKMVNTVTAAGRRRLAAYEARTSAESSGGVWPDHRREARS